PSHKNRRFICFFLAKLLLNESQLGAGEQLRKKIAELQIVDSDKSFEALKVSYIRRGEIQRCPGMGQA
ncbi:MAG: hypothetical protein LPD71_02875, partial [Shewanella sp.]|nr:hypothetical protein [Shewanella sp.]MCF1437714.1 hypothetical protein [Shewanella sp.]